MSIDYIVASLPALAFGEKAPITWEKFVETCAGHVPSNDAWRELETELRNAMAVARGGAKFARASRACSLYWRERVAACFREKDVARREELLDRVWWDAAGELTPPASPLGEGALATYAVRLKIALKRSAISTERGSAAFDALTSATKITFR